MRSTVAVVACLLFGVGGLYPTGLGAQTATLKSDGKTYVLLESGRACSSVRCPQGHVCLQGRCLELRPARDRSCSKVECRDGEACYLGQCLDPEPSYCEAGTCGKNEFCLSGACYEVRTRVPLDRVECESDAVVWSGRCLRPIFEQRVCPEACAEGEVCLDGGCFKPTLGADACTDADCPSGWPCLGGICMKPNERQDWEPCEFCSADDCVLGFCTVPSEP